MKFHLDSNIVEGTPEELVKYQELLKEKEKEEKSLRFSHEHQLTETEQRAIDNFKGLLGSLKIPDSYTTSTESSTNIQVGDRVKVLKSEGRAEGEATVTAVLEDGDVELDGISKDGTYLTNWSNHVSNLEKIEEEIKEARDYVEKVKAEEDAPMGYTFWWLGGTQGRRNNVLKASLEGYFEDSTGTRYTYQAVSGLIKPIDREDICKRFEEAKHYKCLLKYYFTVDEFTMSKY